MDSMPLILARLTVSGLVIINFLILWLFVKQGSNGVQRRRMRRHPIYLPVEVDGKKGVKGLINDLSLGGLQNWRYSARQTRATSPIAALSTWAGIAYCY